MALIISLADGKVFSLNWNSASSAKVIRPTWSDFEPLANLLTTAMAKRLRSSYPW